MVLKTARRLMVAIIGGTVVLFGLILVVTPGPAFIVIPAGLAILATEFAWAKHLLNKLKRKATALGNYVMPNRKNPTDPPPPPPEPL